MTTKISAFSVPWIIAGVVILTLLLVLVFHFRQNENSTNELASKAARVDIVGKMQLDLASASEAEKSAVLAITDEDSQRFADLARASTANVERERIELGSLLADAKYQGEMNLLSQFAKAFSNFQQIDNEVLTLAVKNTNLKAYSLLFGPAADTMTDMDAALARVVAKYADGTDAKRVMFLAFGARIGVLRVQTLLAPHIAEESDAKMDQMETSMTKEEAQIRADLDGLAALPQLAGDADLAIAASSFVHFSEIKERILPLSRENTNVRSLALSLNQKRKAMVLCLDALIVLRQAILDEPIAGVTYGRPAMPR